MQVVNLQRVVNPPFSPVANRRQDAMLHHKMPSSGIYDEPLSNKNTTTPVTETYSQIGNVHRAICRWNRNLLVSPKYRLARIIGKASIESPIWLISTKKYTGRIHPCPINRVSP